MARLKLYRRHIDACPHKGKGIAFDRCKCPIWIRGTWAGEPIRKSLDVDSWAKAEELKQQIEAGKRPEQPKITSVKDAIAAYVSDCESRQLSRRTIGKYRTLTTRFEDWSALHHLRELRDWSQEQADAFRASWKGSGITLSKTLELARVMCRFWHDRGWVERNWFKAIKPPKIKDNPRLPFADEEVQKILSKAKDDRELAFLLTLRHTGLRIGDASLLRTSHFSEGRIYIPATQKAKTPVSVVIPPNLVSLLKALPAPGGYFFLRGESLHPHSTSDAWRKRFKKICKELKISPDHPHRMRHTLAADLLSRGVSVENVAAILGNSPTIVVKHYSQWIRARQEVLDAALESTWKPVLVRVK